MKLTLDLFNIEIPSFIDFLILIILVVIDHSPSLFHSELLFEIVIHELLNYVTASHLILSGLHFKFGSSSCSKVLFNIFIVHAFILINVELLKYKFVNLQELFCNLFIDLKSDLTRSLNSWVCRLPSLQRATFPHELHRQICLLIVIFFFWAYDLFSGINFYYKHALLL